MSDSPSTPFVYVFDQAVKASEVERYFVFSNKLHLLASKQPGFVHQERLKIGEKEGMVLFQTTLKFDTVEHCFTWLDHPERRQILLMEEQEAGFTFKGHANWDGYSRWLSREVRKEAPKWKVTLLVLLTLYPTAMLLTPILHLALHGWGLPGVMLISNILCVAITSWLLVPFASQLSARWLEGDLQPARQTMVLVFFIFLLALFFFAFQSLPASLW
jgi:antibiotic biosynthesis monooxygenase (ABM) superfamily enzyme